MEQTAPPVVDFLSQTRPDNEARLSIRIPVLGPKAESSDFTHKASVNTVQTMKYSFFYWSTILFDAGDS